MAQRSYFLLLLLFLLNSQESTLVLLCTNCSSSFKALCSNKKNNNPKTTNSFSALTLCIRRKTFFFKNSFTIVHTCVCDWTRPLRTRSASQSSCDLRRQITKAICNFFFISLLHICDLHALTYVYVRLLDLPTLSLLAPLYYSTEKYMAEYGFYFSIKKGYEGSWKLRTNNCTCVFTPLKEDNVLFQNTSPYQERFFKKKTSDLLEQIQLSI